jgi:hypothetical protein
MDVKSDGMDPPASRGEDTIRALKHAKGQQAGLLRALTKACRSCLDVGCGDCPLRGAGNQLPNPVSERLGSRDLIAEG